jgi:phosphoribosylformylglycinamidine synthase
MTVAVQPEHIDRFLELSALHAVESTIIGTYTDSGKLHITYDGETCAYVDMDLMKSGFPQWEFEAEWTSPTQRGLHEPVLGTPVETNQLLLDLLSRPNVASKEWIARQYDHEVQGTSVIKPLVGAERDMVSDASVIRPVLSSEKGLAFSQALLPFYSVIDAFHMTTCTVDEAVRRLVAVGAGLDHIGGVDNFCWPSIQYDSQKNPDGKFKAAQLVRSCRALRDMCLAYEIPLLSGKDSMYVDGHLTGRYGESHKISALETLQFSATGIIQEVHKCTTMECKIPGDLVYVAGVTRNEMGGSEYYAHLGYIGCSVPIVIPQKFLKLYHAVAQAINLELVASAHGVYRGGLGVHLAMVAMGGNLGMDLDLKPLPVQGCRRNDALLFSESAGRFILTVDPKKRDAFEAVFKELPCACIGSVIETAELKIADRDGRPVIATPVAQLKKAWKASFGALI